MSHVVMLGDSIFDNGANMAGGLDVRVGRGGKSRCMQCEGNGQAQRQSKARQDILGLRHCGWGTTCIAPRVVSRTNGI
jgi:hypothetical protein